MLSLVFFIIAVTAGLSLFVFQLGRHLNARLCLAILSLTPISLFFISPWLLVVFLICMILLIWPRLRH